MTTRRAVLPLLLAALLPTAPACAKTTFTATRVLSFGRFVAGTGGTIIVSPSGVRSRTGGVLLATSTASSAAFSYTDTASNKSNAGVIITLPADNSVVLSSGTNQMQLKSFTSTPSGTGVMSGGAIQITVGATLTVNANQPKGSYTGSIPITIQYQ
jgi:ABC-type amino acid transport substrate-binding protein